MFWSLTKLFASFTLIVSASTITMGHIINTVIPQPTPTPTPSISESISSDPYIDCGPGQHSKQTLWIRQSICNNYLDCQLTNGTWKFMSKAECNEIQNKKAKISVIQKVNCVGPDGVRMTDKTQEECDAFNNAWNKSKPTQQPAYYNAIKYQGSSQSYVNTTISCTVSYPCTGNSFTYQVTPSTCLSYQQSASNMCNTFKTSTPYPTFSPFSPPTYVADPWPTLGASVPIQNNCETYTNNGGTTTVCK